MKSEKKETKKQQNKRVCLRRERRVWFVLEDLDVGNGLEQLIQDRIETEFARQEKQQVLFHFGEV